MKENIKYQTFQPHPNLASIVKCYWTLEVPKLEHTAKQLIIPDGCIEMIFILGDDVKRYTSDMNFIIQPRQMVLGQITEQFYIEPTGHVNTFAIRFYPFGFANFVSIPIKKLANKETPLRSLFGQKDSNELSSQMSKADDTKQRIKIAETFLLEKLKSKTTVDNIITKTVDTMLMVNGAETIASILKNDLSKRRQLERKFLNKVGISPKKLSKVIRLQAALKMLLDETPENLTKVAYDSEYYDQAHFTKDFKEFTGITPKEFLRDDKMALSALIYKGN